MEVQLIAVPYDTGLRGYRMGAGPARLVDSGLAESLRALGHRVHLEWVEAEPGRVPAEIRTTFELNRALAERVREAVGLGRLPVVLAGACSTALGTLSGLGAAEGTGVLWLDSHGDFNTPETTTGGFLDGMALAMATGRCWTQLAATIPGFRPVPERNVVLAGARDLDPLEAELLSRSAVTVLEPGWAPGGMAAALRTLRGRVGDAYVHLDLDVLDPGEGRANALAAPGGPGLDELRSLLRDVAGALRVRAVALTAYDPACDPEGRVCGAAAALLQALLDPAADGAPLAPLPEDA